MREKIPPVIFILALFILGVSCSSSPSSPSHTISGGPWSGTILSEPVTFTVDENQVKDLQVTFIYVYGAGVPNDTVSWTPDDAEISNNAFSMTDSLSHGFYSCTMSIDGKFDPPSDVSGVFSAEGEYNNQSVHAFCTDTLSWSASHQ